ncbi:type II toxin-antitoxin system RelB/DinJ family antitoxin [Candidatus Gottesmanbacteria bacterium]|nr:type II toxin-antitoxin system RelB/DinJ family antitoxin [Candidatus Gottesmanbacteria bacterium]
MSSTVINVRIERNLKSQAQILANDLGFSVSSLINAFLKQLVRTKSVHFKLEEPTAYLLKALKESRKNIKTGKISPSFKNADNAIKWLNEPNKKKEK